MTDTITRAIELLRDRLTEIDDELARNDDLRTERKTLEATLRKLQPKNSNTAGSVRDDVLAAILTEPKSDWTIDDVLTSLDLNSDSRQAVSTACSSLTSAGKLKRTGRGIYKAA